MFSLRFSQSLKLSISGQTHLMWSISNPVNLLLIEQKFVAMLLFSSAVFQRILTKLGTDNLSGSESNLAKSELEFENNFTYAKP